MKKLFFTFLIIICTYYAYCDSPKIHFDLQKKMNEVNDVTLIPIIILFKNHLSLKDFSEISYDTPRQERRNIVIKRLQGYANNYQRNVRDFLNTKSLRNQKDNYEILWLTNSIVTSLPASDINELTKFDNIEMICYDASYPGELPDSMMSDIFLLGGSENQSINGSPEPGIILMKADQVWTFGNKGKGVLVANADDGFWWKHPDLVHGIWQNLGEDANHNGKTIDIQSGTNSVFDAGDINGIDDDGNGKIDDLIGWDFTTGNYNITTSQHGSATLGLVIGDGTGGTETGVAPESKCILMRNNSGEAEQLLAFQYALQMGADVITSSLSFKWYFSPKPDYSLMRLATDMSLAAGTVHTNSTSNDGGNSAAPVPLNIATVGNCPPPWLHPDQIKRGNLSGVIGVGNVDCLSDIIVSSSPYGPSTWGNWALWGPYTYPIDLNHKDYAYSRTDPVELPDSMGLLKPDVSAPGNSSVSTSVSSGSGYGPFSGTSSATPHTAGCIALMLSINPEMLPQDIDKVLELTSIEKGAPGKGDVKLRSIPFSNTLLSFDSLKFKFLDTSRTIILAARTAASVSSNILLFDINDTNQVAAYYTTKPFNVNFPFTQALSVKFSATNEMTYSLAQNYPNPFNPVTIINYTIAKDGIVKIKIYDVMGKEVAVLVNGFKTKGNYQVEFDANDNRAGAGIPSGVYFYKIESEGFSEIKRMILLK